jgi:hypothetical protein
MKKNNLVDLNIKEIQTINGGIAPLLAYAAAYATVYAAAHVAAYYKGYGDAGAEIVPCTE